MPAAKRSTNGSLCSGSPVMSGPPEGRCTRRRPGGGPGIGVPIGPGSLSRVCAWQFDWGWGPKVPGPDGVLRQTLLFSCGWRVAVPVVLPTWDRTLPTLVSCLHSTFRTLGGARTGPGCFRRPGGFGGGGAPQLRYPSFRERSISSSGSNTKGSLAGSNSSGSPSINRSVYSAGQVPARGTSSALAMNVGRVKRLR
jgi:hypothetical protein